MHTHLPLSVYPPVLGLLLLSTSCSLGDIYLSHTTPMEQAVSVQRLPSAALAVDGPAGALVFIDGVAVGTAPLQARVEPGMRVVVVSARGRNTPPQFVRATAGETVRVVTAVDTAQPDPKLPFESVDSEEYLSAAEGDPGADRIVTQVDALTEQFQACAWHERSSTNYGAAVVQLRLLVRGTRVSVVDPMIAVATDPEVVACVKQVAQQVQLDPSDVEASESLIETVVAVGPRNALEPMFDWFEQGLEAHEAFAACLSREGELVGGASLRRHSDALWAAGGASEETSRGCAQESLGGLLQEPSFVALKVNNTL